MTAESVVKEGWLVRVKKTRMIFFKDIDIRVDVVIETGVEFLRAKILPIGRSE
jgi:hypothetical protein